MELHVNFVQGTVDYVMILHPVPVVFEDTIINLDNVKLVIKHVLLVQQHHLVMVASKGIILSLISVNNVFFLV